MKEYCLLILVAVSPMLFGCSTTKRNVEPVQMQKARVALDEVREVSCSSPHCCSGLVGVLESVMDELEHINHRLDSMSQ